MYRDSTQALSALPEYAHTSSLSPHTLAVSVLIHQQLKSSYTSIHTARLSPPRPSELLFSLFELDTHTQTHTHTHRSAVATASVRAILAVGIPSTCARPISLRRRGRVAVASSFSENRALPPALRGAAWRISVVSTARMNV